MGKKFGLVAIRLMVSVNLLYAAIFAKFAGVPQSVALFTQMSQAVHGLISQPVFRLGSGVFETMVAVLFLIPKTARLGARLVILWMTAIIFSHIFVLGYGLFFVDALVLMLLAASYLLLTRSQSKWDGPKNLETMAALQTHKNSRANSWKRSYQILINSFIADGGYFAIDTAPHLIGIILNGYDVSVPGREDGIALRAT